MQKNPEVHAQRGNQMDGSSTQEKDMEIHIHSNGELIVEF